MSDINAVLVRDSRFNVSSEANYAVEKGAMSSNIQVYRSNSATPSSVTFAIQTPSLNTLIDRNITWDGKFVIKLSCTTNTSASGVALLSYGKSDSLAPYPMNNACINQQVTLNNNTFNINQQDLTPFLNRFIDKENAVKLNSVCPTTPDKYFGDLSQGVNSHGNSMGSISDADQNNTVLPRGSYRVLGSSTTSTVTENTFVDIPVGANPGVANTIYLLVESKEPLLLSPFLYSDPAHNPAIYGIQTMNFQFTLNPVLNRSWRHVDQPDQATVDFRCELISWAECNLQIQYLTAHSSMNLPASNVVYYNDISRYQFVGNTTITAAVPSTYNHITPGEYTITTGTITLNNISDKYFIGVRKKIAVQTPKDADKWFPIKSMNLTWDTRSGLLTTYKKDDLFRMSNKCGLNMSWLEFKGVANQHVADVPGSGTYLKTAYGRDVPTTGGFVAWSPVYDMTLSEEWFSAGSIGSFTFQASVTFENYYNEAVGQNDWEVVFVCVTSGVLVNQAGSTSKYIAILDREKVLQVSSAQEYYHGDDVERLIGGRSFLDRSKGIMGSLLSKLRPAVERGMSMARTAAPYVEKGVKVMKALGYGKKQKLEKFLEE